MLAADDLDVEAHRHLVAELADCAGAPVRILQRRSTDIDPRATGGQCRPQRLVVPDAAGQFDFDIQRPDHLGKQFAVAAPAERSIEVNQVDPLRAIALPGECSIQSRTVFGLAAGLALDQSDGTALDHIDGGQQNQCIHSPSTQFASSAAPASPLFSGWNCVADSGPSSTAARNRTWWVAQVSSASGLPSQACAA